jgi:hypothetical protein
LLPNHPWTGSEHQVAQQAKAKKRDKESKKGPSERLGISAREASLRT